MSSENTEHNDVTGTSGRDRFLTACLDAVAGDILVAVDRDGCITFINQGGCELLGRNWFDTCLPADIREQVRGVFERLLSGDDVPPVEAYENAVLTRAGEERLNTWHNTVIYDDTGGISGTFSCGSDITEHCKTAASLQASEDRYHHLLDTAGVAILCLAPDFTVEEWNRTAEEIYGWRRHEIIGRNYVETCLPAELRDSVANEIRAVLAGKDAVNYEHPVQARNGDTRVVLLNSTRMADNDGQATGLIAIGVNITDRKQDMLALQESEDRLQAIVDTAVEGIITIDESGIIESFNRASESIFGYEAKEMIGQSVSMLMPSPYREEYDSHLTNYLVTGKREIIGVGREVEGCRKDGTIFPLYIAVSEVKLNDRHIFTGLVRDISERKEAEAQLRQTQEQLTVQTLFTQQLTALASMAGGIAHELNQPLSGIRVYAETVRNMIERRSIDHEWSAGTLSKIISQVDRASQVIEHMREFAAEKRRISDELVDVSEIVERSLDLVGTQLRNHGIEFVNGIPVGVQVRTDAVRLEQVFINLITNARDGIDSATSESRPVRRISMACEETDSQIVLNISDTGTGVPVELRERIFEPFVTSKGPDRGTGLGLSVCHGILRDYSATIRLGDTGPDGTTFIIAFPIP